MTLEDKIKHFSELLENARLLRLELEDLSCEANRLNCKVRIRPGPKYIKVDVGNSGAYMVEATTGNIYGIKAYGVAHKGKYYGTLDTVHDWNWGGYYATPRRAS